MCDKCDGKILFTVGEIKGIVEGIKGKQADIHKTVTDNRIAAQDDFKSLSADITKVKIKVVGAAAIFGSIAGFISRYIPS